MKKTVDFWEVSVKFVVRKGTRSADSKKVLKGDVLIALDGIHMRGIQAEQIEVNIID